MFNLKVNPKQHQQPDRAYYAKKRSSSGSSSILEQIIGHLKSPGGGQNENSKHDSLQRRLLRKTNHLRARLDQFQCGLRSDLRRSFSSLVQATTGPASQARPAAGGAARNGHAHQRRPLSRQFSGGLCGPAKRGRPSAGAPPLRRTMSLNQRRGSQPAKTLAEPASKPRGQWWAGAVSVCSAKRDKILIERNDWSTKSLQAKLETRRQSARSGRLLAPQQDQQCAKSAGGSSRSLFGCRSQQAPLLFVSALQLLLALVVLLGSREVAQAAPIRPFLTGGGRIWLNRQQVAERARADSAVDEADVVGVQLDDDIADELYKRLKQIATASEANPPAWSAPERASDSGESEEFPALLDGRDADAPRRQAKPDEFVWIERRRLDRDRALEPPAWLRARPIRGPRQPAADQWDEQPEASPAERGNRQSRDSSNFLYDEALATFVDDVIGGYAAINRLKDELESRGQGSRDRLQPASARDQSPEPVSESGALVGGIGTGQGGLQADSGTALKQQQQAQSVGGDETLVVAGDEVSDSDEVTLLAPTTGADQRRLQLQQQARPDQSTTVLLRDQTLAPGPAGSQAGKFAPGSRDLLAAQQTDQAASLGEADSASLPLDSSAGSLIDLLQSTNQQSQLLTQQQQQQQLQPLQEEPFHVYEDLDQVDNSQEISPPDSSSPQQQQQADGQAVGREQQLTPGGWPRAELEKRSLLSQQLAAKLSELDALRQQEAVNLLTGALRRTLLGRDESVRGLAANETPLGARVDSAPDVGSLIMQRAIERVQAGYYSHGELLAIAAHLKLSLERSLGLPVNGIEKISPEGARQLQAKVDLARLNPLELEQLARNPNYVAARKSLLLSYKDVAAGEQPNNRLALLAETLKRIVNNERLAALGAGGPAPPEEAPLTGAGRINEQALGGTIQMELAAAGDEDRPEEDAGDGRRADNQDAGGRPRQWPVSWPRPAPAQVRRPPLISATSELHQPQVWMERPLATAGVSQLPAWLAESSWGTDSLRPPVAGPQRPAWPEPDEFYAARQAARTPAQGAALVDYLSGPAGADTAGPPPEVDAAVLLRGLDDGQLWQLAQRLALIQAEQRAAQHVPAPNRTQPAAAGLGRFLGASLRGDDGDFRSGSLWMSLAALLSALALTVMLVKLTMRRLDRAGHAGRRLSSLSSFSCSTVSSKARFWAPFAKAHSPPAEEDCCATIKGETVSAGGRGQDLGRAPAELLHKRGLSADSGLDTIDGPAEGAAGSGSTSDKLRRNFDLLAERLARLMSSARSRDDEPEGGPREAPGAPAEADASEGPAGAAEPGEGRQFRSSTSYIRSLIEALTKAASVQMASKAGGRRAGSDPADPDNDEDGDDDDDDEDDDRDRGCGPDEERADQLVELEAEGAKAGQRRRRRTESQSAGEQRHLFADDQDEILMSQMDISAAHLILDYMEKHLVDKERLRREWLELSAAAAASKAHQLLLQRLAKVALSEENLAKNRDPAVVPFDRNRVRLGRAEQQPDQAGPSSGRAPRRPQARAGRASGDYINASFIYDDDPRRPTHIVAQGPKEQTRGQFWQMVWEQEVAVIVMLTRLNENGVQMCHCYWPTSVAEPASGAAAAPAGSSSSPPPPPAGSGSARRGSVTSVFSGPSVGRQTAAGLQPIVAGGEPNDNALHFELGAARLEVRLVSEHVSSGDYLVRNMYLINRSTGETRTVSQFHYLAWLEGRTPDNVRSFLQFRRKVHKSYRNSGSPILVHCSDGAGRAGTYTLIDMILERIKNGAKEIDLRATLEHLRDQRPGLCASQSQFEFALVALAEEIQIILNALPQ